MWDDADSDIKAGIHHVGLMGTCTLIHMLHTSTIYHAKCPLLRATEHVMMSHVDKLIDCQLYGQEAVCAGSCPSMLAAPQCIVATVAGCLFGACCTACCLVGSCVLSGVEGTMQSSALKQPS